MSVMDLFGGIGIAVCGSPLAHLPAVLRRATNQLVARREINILDGCCQNLSVTEVIAARQLFINQLAVFDLQKPSAPSRLSLILSAIAVSPQ